MVSFKSMLCLLLTVFVVPATRSANILFFFQLSSYSHRLGVWPLVEELVARGHNVTFHQLIHPRNSNPNVTEFFPKSLHEAIKLFGKGFSPNQLLTNREQSLSSWSATIPLYFLLSAPLALCEIFLSAPETIEFVKTAKFDLIVIDSFYNECAYGLAYKFGAKTILYSATYPSNAWSTETLGFLGTPLNSWDTDRVAVHQHSNTFLERVVNTLDAAFLQVFLNWFQYPRLDDILKRKLDIPNMPSVIQMKQETQIFFYNSHFSVEAARSLPPSYVSVAGMQCWNPTSKPLSKEVKAFIEGSGENGFIYVSFGSQLDMGKTSKEFQNAFINAFGKSNVHFMWRRSGVLSEGMPKNIYISDWLPQMELLRHPKCRAYIGHAGLYGILEAVMTATPLIVLPVFGDQFYNALRVEQQGRGISLEISTVTEDSLAEAIQEILHNQSYKRNTERVSRQFKDQEMSPLERATYWTEYVLRNENPKVFQTPYASTTYWFQRFLLDVWAFILGLSLALILTFLYLGTRMIKFLFFSKRNTVLKKEKTN